MTVEEKLAATRGVEVHFDLDRVHQGYLRVQKSGKVKSVKTKQLVEKLRLARNTKQEAASVKHAGLRADAKDKYSYLREKDNQRS